jgi:hypothetical protein
MISYEQYLRSSTILREAINVFLDSSKPSWARFDPELGYVLGNSMPTDGLDGCSTISTAQKNGARTSHVYAGRPCRLNTYGNSFTQCHQASDGETWQEYLAGHLGEPVLNYGMGGYGVYQAYRRMIRVERTDGGAEYLILYIWGDDHFRSVMRCRYASIHPWFNHRGGMAFHNNFWANIEMDLETQRMVEKDNLLPTRESLYKMTDPDFMCEALEDDLMVQLAVAGRVDPSSLDTTRLNALAGILGVEGIMKASSPDDLKASLERIKNAYGFAATKYILDEAFRFSRKNGKKLMIFLLCPRVTRQLLRGEARYEQEIVDYMKEKGLPYFDMNLVHFEDFKAFDLSIEDYLKRYYIGHYSPAGNHFFAYSVKDRIVEWLDPKPITYRSGDQPPTDFEGYLPDYS